MLESVGGGRVYKASEFHLGGNKQDCQQGCQLCPNLLMPLDEYFMSLPPAQGEAAGGGCVGGSACRWICGG